MYTYRNGTHVLVILRENFDKEAYNFGVVCQNLRSAKFCIMRYILNHAAEAVTLNYEFTTLFGKSRLHSNQFL